MTTNRKKRRLTKTTAATPPESTSNKFTHGTHELPSTNRPHDLNTTTVYLLRPPKSAVSSSRPWIATREITADYNFIFRHPLTSKRHSFNLPPDFYFPQLNPTTLSVFYAFGKSNSVDKLLVLPPPSSVDIRKCNLFALYGGGQLQACPRDSPWVKLSHRDSPWVKFDDIIELKDKTYVVDRWGIINLVNHYKTVSTISLGKTLISEPLIPGTGRFGWRKRFAVDGEILYLVVRTEEKLFKVFRLMSEKKGGKNCFYWDRVKGFGGNKVLFMARDCYFFRRASRKFPGREYRNCIVFSEAAFPQYGNDGWEFTQSGDRQLSEDDIAVFRLDDERFAREGEGEGEKSGFPKIDWSPPVWILNVSSFIEDDFSMHSVSESSGQSEREPGEVEVLDSDSGDKNDGEVQSDLKNSKSKVEEEQEEMESDFGCLDQDQGSVELDSGNQDQEDEKLQCDLNSQEKEDEESPPDSDSQHQEDEKLQCDSNRQVKEDEEMHYSEEAIIEGDATLQKDPVMPSRSAVEVEVTRTLLRMNSGNDSIKEETSGENITQAIPTASTSSRTESYKSDAATIKFEGLDIRPHLVPTLQKIWRKHGNITKDSIVRSSDIISRALESLAIVVQILEDNLAQSLSDSQADYLSSTLSDLKCLHFNVYWLVSFVEEALKIHKSKDLMESLNKLSQLSSQVKERKSVILDELAKLNDEENKMKEEMAKVSKTIPLYGQVKFDEPIGVGLM